MAVFHATSGVVTNAEVARLHGLIGNPPVGTSRAIYAISNPWDSNYAIGAGAIEAYIGQPNTVCYLQTIIVPQFGINAKGYIGF